MKINISWIKWRKNLGMTNLPYKVHLIKWMKINISSFFRLLLMTWSRCPWLTIFITPFWCFIIKILQGLVPIFSCIHHYDVVNFSLLMKPHFFVNHMEDMILFHASFRCLILIVIQVLDLASTLCIILMLSSL